MEGISIPNTPSAYTAGAAASLIYTGSPQAAFIMGRIIQKGTKDSRQKSTRRITVIFRSVIVFRPLFEQHHG